ncbi:phosphatidylserine decarboxylase [Helicobacter cholecystus]|uniref:phosphatidylserine decarboxylase n=1 Tax=Helicobacter cholecystus TaxID=45498 RepID=A0A3D8IWC7_9HELI|nr:phosphatidylserine decarboxylase [Helicobacter cholecystus]RDU69266.1 phosphatidylserine decarboxylase [Helicobacter cholecystus]
MLSNRISRYFGKFASHSFSPKIQKIINSVYVKIFNIDLSEFENIESYPTLNALFTRELKVERQFDKSPKTIISPCDSLIMEQGFVQNNTALQIKGMIYCVSELLGEALENEYFYTNYYLSPRDYHRYHAHCDMWIEEVRYFAGELLAVNRPSLLKNHNLFIRNERVVIIARDNKRNRVYYVAVGALNVGQMVVNFEPRVQTNTQANISTSYTYSEPIFIAKGEEVGMFKMGSTILVFQKDYTPFAHVGEKVRFGESVGEFTD